MTQRSSSRTPPANQRNADGSMVDDRLAKLTAQFDLLKAQVRQAQQLSSLGTAAATIAHEVNNLLTPILSYADFAMQSGDPELAKKALAVTARNTRMLIAMSERILELGAAKTSRRENVSVRRAVEDAHASLCRDLSKDGITFDMNVDESLTVYADPLQLRQILFNLFLNAREAMAPHHNGRLTVTAEKSQISNLKTRKADTRNGVEVGIGIRQGSSGTSPALDSRQSAFDNRHVVVIQIRNTGPPIAPDLLPHLFEPFQTSKPTTRSGKARCGGLGLALVRDLVEENTGTIAAASNETGITFTIRLPLGR